MMKRLLCSIALVAATALAGCDQQDHNIVAGGPSDPDANLANQSAVTLPPAIQASHTYRCKDNSLLYVDWYSDGSARVKTSQGDAGTAIPAAVEGGPASPLTGTADAASISFSGKSCKR